MATPLLERKQVLVLELEGTEGTPATLAAVDGKMRIYDPRFEIDPNLQERDPARSSLTPLAGVIGKQTVPISWRSELKGSGSVATRPAWDKALRACGFTSAAVSTISIGAISGGPFLPGELITGATSGGTGRIVGEISTGAAVVHYVPVSGTITDAETLTGGDSAATAFTEGDTAGSQGFEYRPASEGVPSASIGSYKDGTRGRAHGARGNVRLTARAGEIAFLEFSFSGVFTSFSDAALPAVTYESTIPPAFLDSGHRFDGQTIPFASMNIDAGNNVVEREDARAEKGVLSFFISERAPRLTLDPEDALIATVDYRNRMLTKQGGYFFGRVGSVAGNRIWVSAPNLDYRSVRPADRNRLAVVEIEFGLVTNEVGDYDDAELQIAVV